MTMTKDYWLVIIFIASFSIAQTYFVNDDIAQDAVIREKVK
jgi:hypothetical protein